MIRICVRVPRILATTTIQGRCLFVQSFQLRGDYSRAASIRRNTVLFLHVDIWPIVYDEVGSVILLAAGSTGHCYHVQLN